MINISPKDNLYSIEAIYKFFKFLYWYVLEEKLKKRLVNFGTLDDKTLFFLELTFKVKLSKFAITAMISSVTPHTKKEEILGATLFVGLMAEVDRIIDNKDFWGFKDKDEVKKRILESNIVDENENDVMYKNKKIKIQEFLEVILEKFDKNKQKLINEFLDSASKAEFRLKNLKSINKSSSIIYKFEEVKEYRENTTIKLIELMRRLADVPLRMKKSAISGGWTVQLLDSIIDAREDYIKGVANEFVSILYENGELEDYLNGEKYKTSKSQFDKILQSYTKEVDPIVGRFILFFWRYYFWFRFG